MLCVAPLELFYNSMLNSFCKHINIIIMVELYSFEQMDLLDQYSYATLSCQGSESGTLIFGSSACEYLNLLHPAIGMTLF